MGTVDIGFVDEDSLSMGEDEFYYREKYLQEAEEVSNDLAWWLGKSKRLNGQEFKYTWLAVLSTHTRLNNTIENFKVASDEETFKDTNLFYLELNLMRNEMEKAVKTLLKLEGVL